MWYISLALPLVPLTLNTVKRNAATTFKLKKKSLDSFIRKERIWLKKLKVNENRVVREVEEILFQTSEQTNIELLKAFSFALAFL